MVIAATNPFMSVSLGHALTLPAALSFAMPICETYATFSVASWVKKFRSRSIDP